VRCGAVRSRLGMMEITPRAPVLLVGSKIVGFVGDRNRMSSVIELMFLVFFFWV